MEWLSAVLFCLVAFAVADGSTCSDSETSQNINIATMVGTVFGAAMTGLIPVIIYCASNEDQFLKAYEDWYETPMTTNAEVNLLAKLVSGPFMVPLPKWAGGGSDDLFWMESDPDGVTVMRVLASGDEGSDIRQQPGVLKPEPGVVSLRTRVCYICVDKVYTILDTFARQTACHETARCWRRTICWRRGTGGLVEKAANDFARSPFFYLFSQEGRLWASERYSHQLGAFLRLCEEYADKHAEGWRKQVEQAKNLPDEAGSHSQYEYSVDTESDGGLSGSVTSRPTYDHHTSSALRGIHPKNKYFVPKYETALAMKLKN